MGRLQQRALQRVTNRLRLPADEPPLAFDIGKETLAILPSPFPFPLPRGIKRIDLVVTKRALYVHAGGKYTSYPFSELLWARLDESEGFGSTFRFRLTNGEEGQVVIGRHPMRDFYKTLAEQLKAHEASLSHKDRAARTTVADHIDAADELKRARREVLGRHSGLPGLDFQLGFKGDITQPDGTPKGCRGGVTLEMPGISFYEGDHTRKIYTISYEFITDASLDKTATKIHGKCSDGTTFEVRANKPTVSVEEFLGELWELMATKLRE